MGQEDFLNEVQAKGRYFLEGLKAIDSDAILDVRGLGLMIGVEVGPEHIAEYLKALQDQGVLAIKAGAGTIRLLPPLVLTYPEMDQAIAAFKEVLA